MKCILIPLACTFVVLMFFSGCQRVKPNPPEESTLDTVLATPLSVINLPVRYRVSAIQDMLNEKVKGTFIKKWIRVSDKGDSLYLEVSRKNTIKLSRKGTTLKMKVPLFVSGRFKARFAGIRLRNSKPVDADLVLHLSTALRLDRQWNLVSKLKIEKVEWNKTPKIRVGFAKVNLKNPLENALQKNEDQITHKADSVLQKMLNTRKLVENLWLEIQKPIRVNKKGLETWLKAYAEDLSGFVEETEPDLISFSFKLKAYTQTIFEGDSIPASNEKLPPFTNHRSENDSLRIFVYSKIDFARINRALQSELKEKELAARGFATKIQDVKVYGTPSGLAVKLDVKGDVTGKLYFTGTPTFDTLSSILGIENFDFAVDTESTLLNSAEWLLHTHVVDMVREKFQVNIQSLTAQLPNIINQGIERGKTGEKINVNIETLYVRPVTILTTKDNIQLILKGNGRATLDLEKKIFDKKRKRV